MNCGPRRWYNCHQRTLLWSHRCYRAAWFWAYCFGTHGRSSPSAEIPAPHAERPGVDRRTAVPSSTRRFVHALPSSGVARARPGPTHFCVLSSVECNLCSGNVVQGDTPPPPASPTSAEVRQVPPALRKWLRTCILGDGAGEALQSPLTATHGIFCKMPIMHEALVADAQASEWNFDVDAVGMRGWEQRAWPHHVLVTVEKAAEGSLDRVITKAINTKAMGRRVVVVAATSQSWKQLRKTGAHSLLRLQPGSIPLGDATGWPDAPSTRTCSDGTAKRVVGRRRGGRGGRRQRQ